LPSTTAAAPESSTKARARSSGPACRAAPSLPTPSASSSHALAYNLGNFMRTLAMPKTAEPWSLTSLREKLTKIRRQGRPPRSLRHLPDGRGRGAAADVCGNLIAHRPATIAARSAMTAAVSDETEYEGRGVPRMKQSHEFRTREASNPNDWGRTRLVAAEFHCGGPR
jgi:hypothetical protein